MGIDYYSCNYCNEAFSDYDEGYTSCNCGNRWCSEECAKEDGYKKHSCQLGYNVDDNECKNSCYGCKNEIEQSCKYCREEDFADNELLDYAMELLSLNREELIKLFKLEK